jgi:hypothetical protein
LVTRLIPSDEGKSTGGVPPAWTITESLMETVAQPP